jgi:hypothetical protein
MDTKTSSDFFNGVNAVRFDLVHHRAYVSIGFDDNSDDIYLQINGNSPPTIDVYSPTETNLEINEGESIEFTHTSSDLDGDLLSYSWLLDTVEKATTQNWTYSTSSGDIGVRNVTLVVSDGEFIDTQEWTVTVNDLVLSVKGLKCWHWSDTNINSVVEADVDGDGAAEIVTAGYYNDGARDVAQLVVWNGTTLEVENIKVWYWTNDTRISSVAVADVDDDSDLEIVTGGYFNDGVRDIAQLVVWDGSTLAVDTLTGWYWTGDTRINSVAVADVDGDGADEIVTGGYYTDGDKMAQLVVWNGTSMAVENVAAWYWTADTQINSVAIGNVDMDSGVEIVTGGYYYDDARDWAQLVTWDGASLAVENVMVWYWTGDTRISSVAVADVDGDGADEIVTGGYYTDGDKMAQLVVWNGTSMAVENVVAWYWTGETVINSVAIGNVDVDASAEIVTAGYYNDGERNVAQLVVWDGSNLAVDTLTAWYWTGDTGINSVAVGNVDADVSEEIVTAGYYDDGANVNAQLVVWAITTN